MPPRLKRGATPPPSADLAPPAPRIRRRYHFGSPGLIYIFITLLVALGAFNSQNNLLFWGFGFSLATLVVSGYLSGAMLMAITLERERIREVHAGEPLVVRYRIRNSNRFIPAFALTIEEGFAEPTAAASAPRGRGRRSLGPAHRPQPPHPAVEQPYTFVAHVGPRESVIAEGSTPTRRRGPVAFRSVMVHTSFPFGLMRKSLEFDDPARVVVLPALVQFDPSILDTAAASGDSQRSSRLRGPGDEFHALREYLPGDSPRTVAWKASARRGILLVRQSLAPAPPRLWLVLRLRIEANGTDALDERAISLAASMIERARARSIAVGLSVPLVNLGIPPRGDPAHYQRLLSELGQLGLGPADGRGLRVPFPLAAATARSACICIHAGTSDASFGPAQLVTHVPAGGVGEGATIVAPPPRERARPRQGVRPGRAVNEGRA